MAAAIDPSFFDTYNQYKTGTNKMMTWLASRAREMKTFDDLFPDTSNTKDTKGKGRLKGKARAAQKAPQKENSQIHQVPLAAIPRIAKAIASKVQEVPGTIVRTLEAVIAARSACNECFEQHGSTDKSTQASNQKHQHFIGILRETLHILKPLSRESTKAAKGKDSKESQVRANEDVAGLGNRFEGLTVDEPNEWTSSSLPSMSTKSLDTYELEPTDEDISFAIFCLFKDLTDIRHYVRQTWAEYREHQIAFTTASVTMNVAIAVIRRLNEEFIANFPQFDDHGQIINYLCDGYYDPKCHNKYDKDFASYKGADFQIPSKVFFCDRAHELLGWFAAQDELFVPQDQARSSELRFTEDEETLLKCLSLFCLTITRQDGQFYADQLVQGLFISQKDDKFYTWVVFAVQLFIDTRRVVGKELDRCLEEAKKLQKWMSESLEQYLQLGKTNTDYVHYKVNSGSVQTMKKKLDMLIEQDFIQEVLNRALGAGAARYSWGSFSLFRNHPMALGLTTQHFLMSTHELGISLGSDAGAIMASIHLYNASQQSDNISKSQEWIDLEILINGQDPAWIFVGDRPKSPAECFRHWSLVLGLSATIMARDRNGNPISRLGENNVPFASKKIRKLRLMSKYADVLTTQSHAKPTAGSIRLVTTRAFKEPLALLEMLVAKELESSVETRGRVLSSGRKNSSQRTEVHPLRMISIFKEALKSDQRALRVDLLDISSNDSQIS